ncbi:acyl carrier protein [Thermoanaerobacteraceae bacterium SP2]|nr:acyl carrier protein [Thermoanaerobacteraceae bacterium SP2]
MNSDQFLVKLQECLMDDSKNFGPSTNLEDIDGWDSIGRLAVAVMINTELGISITAPQLRGCSIVNDIIELVKDKLEV